MTDPLLEQSFERVLAARKPKPNPEEIAAQKLAKQTRKKRTVTLCVHGKRKWRSRNLPYCKLCYRPYGNTRLRILRANKTAAQVRGNSEALLWL